MSIQLVSNVPLLPQDMTNACWYFCARMMYEWSVKAGKTILDITQNQTLTNLYTGNCGYAPSTAKDLATKLNMNALPRVSRGLADYQSELQKGPLWAQGLKGGASGFPHVVVITGVADTGVYIHDPLPLLKGERGWKTWKWLDDYLQITDPSMDANFLGPK